MVIVPPPDGAYYGNNSLDIGSTTGAGLSRSMQRYIITRNLDYERSIESVYESAKEEYANLGVNTDEAIQKMEKMKISLHCKENS